MKSPFFYLPLLFTALTLLSCHDKNTPPQTQAPNANSNMIQQTTPPIKINVGDNLEPYIGKTVQVTGKVTNTKIPSLGNGWLSLSNFHGGPHQTIQVTGKITKGTASPPATDKNGNTLTFASSKGTFYKINGDIININKSPAESD